MTSKFWICQVATMLLLSASCFADEQGNKLETVNDLFKFCALPNLVAKAYCKGYFDGVSISMIVAERRANQKHYKLNLAWCSDAGISSQQMLDAFMHWHDKNPESWEQPKWVGVIGVIQQTWPCKN